MCSMHKYNDAILTCKRVKIRHDGGIFLIYANGLYSPLPKKRIIQPWCNKVPYITSTDKKISRWLFPYQRKTHFGTRGNISGSDLHIHQIAE